MIRKKILFDLDGTVIDARCRLYNLFCFLVPQSRLTFEEYWTLKRQKRDHSSILKNNFHWTDSAISTFQERWLKLIEEPRWLGYDKVFEGGTEVLKELANTCDLYLFTARQSETNVLRQLEDLQLRCFFKAVYVTEHKVDKQTLFQNSALVVAAHDIAVGDTGVDVALAKSLRCVSVAVESGFRSKEALSHYFPDYILPSIVDPRFINICLQ